MVFFYYRRCRLDILHMYILFFLCYSRTRLVHKSEKQWLGKNLTWWISIGNWVLIQILVSEQKIVNLIQKTNKEVIFC